MVETITIFVLAIFVGYYVVWGVTPALHTPLMAVTNALSSIIIVGAMIQTVGLPMIGVEGSVDFQSINVVSVLGAIAVFLASINIFGGFAVTARMLEMFKPKQKIRGRKHGIYSSKRRVVLPDRCSPVYYDASRIVWT